MEATCTMRSDRPRPLAELLAGLPFGEAGHSGPSPVIHRVVADSRLVQPGDLFVAVPGHQQDGHEFADEAVRRGAVAIVAEQDAQVRQGVPVIRVADSRRALAELAARWFEHPAERLRLVGITGSFGKSGTLHMLRAILERAGIAAGSLGSDFIGLDIPGQPNRPLDHTTPDALELHRALARVADSGAGVCALEVSSQGLVQDRVHGLAFDLGIVTTIVPLEHSEYHETFRSYVAAKELFLCQLRPRAPVIYPAGERVVDALVRRHDVTPVSCQAAAGSDAAVCYHGLDLRLGRTRLVVEVRRPLPLGEGGTVGPLTLPLELRLPGRGNAGNAVLAAVAGLCLGADPEAVREALADLRPGVRRLELTRLGGFQMLDDTATHPESLNVLFEIVRGIPHRRLHLVTAIRGGRHVELNRRYGEAIGIWSKHCPIHGVTATSSSDAVDEADRVDPAERDAFLAALRKAGLPYQLQETLDGAVRAALEQVGEGDLLVLLGAQGMHGGADLVRQRVDAATGPRPQRGAPPREAGGQTQPPGPGAQPEVEVP